jgi:WD40 repeat protein
MSEGAELAEALGKEIILAIVRDLQVDDPLLARYRDRQFVDLSAFPQDHIEALTWKGREHRIGFNVDALSKIKIRLDELGISPGSFAWPPKGVTQPTPYPGLSAFEEEDAGIFFGRDADIMGALTEVRLIRRRGSPRLLVIDAASGAGKSSFLRAGLWARLKRDPEFAPLALLRPAQGILSGPNGIGRRIAPFFERHGVPRAAGTIYSALLQANEDMASAAFIGLITDAAELATKTRQAAAPDAKAPAPLLAIDQAEELFRAEDEEESQRFLTILAKLLNEPPPGLDPYVLLTIRADSVQKLLTRAAQLHLETPKAIYLAPLSQAVYREVILRPAEIYSARIKRLSIEPSLASTLVADASGADALPLLAFTLEQMFIDFQGDGNLTLDRYLGIGGVSGSIARALRRARQNTGSSGSDEHLRRLMLPRLATWDPEADEGKGAAKRLVAIYEDVAGGPRADLAPLANALVGARLLTRGRDTLEVAHEALLRQPPISKWIAEDREFLIWLSNISRARQLEDINTGDLFFGGPLEDAKRWISERTEDIPALDLQFITEALREEENRRMAEVRRREEEVTRQLQEQKLKARAAEEREKQAAQMSAASRRLARRTAFGLGAALTLAVLTGIAGIVARRATARAVQAQNEALETRNAAQLNQSQFLTDLAGQQRAAHDQGTAALLALEALPDRASEYDSARTRPLWLQAEDAVNRALEDLQESVVLGSHQGTVYSATFSPDGARVLTGSYDGTVRLWEAETGVEIMQFAASGKVVAAVAFSPDGTRIAAGLGDPASSRTGGEVRVWDAKTQRELIQVRGAFGNIDSISFSRDRLRIAAASDDGIARILDAGTGQILRELIGHKEAVWAFDFSPDGLRAVTGSGDRTAIIWDTQTGAKIKELKHSDVVAAAAFSPDGTRILTGCYDHIARLFDAGTGAELGPPFIGRGQLIRSVAFSRSGGYILTGSWDRTARVWDAETRTEVLRLSGHSGEIAGAALSITVAFLVRL